MVTKNLNKRSALPPTLPFEGNIVDVVPKGYVFSGTEVLPGPGINLPQPPLDKWYKDDAGYFYWAGALLVVKSDIVAAQPSTAGGAVSALQLKAATGATSANAGKFMPYIIDTCEKFQINTPVRMLCFLAQVGHESGGLFFTEELASGQKYEGNIKSLGNTEPGDGVRFKGRGLIQITGRANYQRVKNDLGIDCITHPELLGGKNANFCTPEQLKNAALSAGWFWDKHSLNSFADKIDINTPIESQQNYDAFETMTEKINGGTNGLPDRLARYKAGADLFRQKID